MERIYVDRYTGKISRTDVYRVSLTLRDGKVIENLEPRKLFPHSNQSMYITLLDEQENEVALVRDFEELDPESAEALKACFAEYYMIPKIQRIISIEDKIGTLRWEVETDHGNVKFRIKHRHNDIRFSKDGKHYLIRDSNDNRYEIVDFYALDAKSRRLLFPFT